VPFKEVYIHALVRDANREKMSKTKGNVIDPIEIVKQYGTDAVRFTLASMASPGTDIAFNVARTEGYRAFANKIWNAARFLFMNVDRAAEIGIAVDPAILGGVPVISEDAPREDCWIVDELQKAAWRVNKSLESYRYDDAANEIYQFFWGSFCDVYIESVKLRLDFSEDTDKTRTKAALTTLVNVFEASLRLLSPFMPFITEEIWQNLYEGNPPVRSIALSSYPFIELDWLAIHNRGASDPGFQMIRLLELKTAVLALRKEIGVEEKARVSIMLRCEPWIKDPLLQNGIIDVNRDLFGRLAKVSQIQQVQNSGKIPPELARRIGSDFEVAVIPDGIERTIDVAAERERLTKDIAKYEKGLAAAERQLGNEGFLAKAPAHIVEGLKKQESETLLLLEKARAALEALPN
jgi:valyl-tRNA synthetase